MSLFTQPEIRFGLHCSLQSVLDINTIETGVFYGQLGGHSNEMVGKINVCQSVTLSFVHV